MTANNLTVSDITPGGHVIPSGGNILFNFGVSNGTAITSAATSGTTTSDVTLAPNQTYSVTYQANPNIGAAPAGSTNYQFTIFPTLNGTIAGPNPSLNYTTGIPAGTAFQALSGSTIIQTGPTPGTLALEVGSVDADGPFSINWANAGMSVVKLQ
ncbi:hypothetical protein ACE3NQ_29110 [Paenibacillus terreus]|uniref:BclA C-terminal domain-containing protein n=1 Tax=Paenibacillus terreus TaxID=1387834 RepID=A0ABV5BGZ6_9BACL